MKKFRYVYCESVDTPDGMYCVDVQIPIDYDSKEAAQKNHASCRFELENGHVVLKIYSDWHQGLDCEMPQKLADENLKSLEDYKKRDAWVQEHWHEGCCGKVIKIIHDNEIERTGVAIHGYVTGDPLPELPGLEVMDVDMSNEIKKPWDDFFRSDQL